MGWTPYNFFGASHNERLFHLMAQAYEAAGLRAAGYDILRIDGGWWGDDGHGTTSCVFDQHRLEGPQSGVDGRMADQPRHRRRRIRLCKQP